MKQATGELNMTLVVVVIIAVLSSFFFAVLWPNIKGSFRASSKCDSAICECPSGYSDSTGACTYTGSTVECYSKDDPSDTFTCTWKG